MSYQICKHFLKELPIIANRFTRAVVIYKKKLHMISCSFIHSFIHSFNLFYPRYPFRYKIPDLPRGRAKNIIVYTLLIIK